MAGQKIAAISIIKLQSDITDISKDLKLLKAQSNSAKGAVGSLGSALGKLAAAGAVIATLKQIGGALIDNARRFEKYEAMLKVATGSTAAAAKEFDRLKKFAIDTPFTIDELTKAFVLLNNRGLNPTNKQMTAMADIAASLGRTYEDVAMAALRASSGETERMRNMGIEASVQGDKIKLSFKGITRTIDRNITSIVGLLEEMGQIPGVFGTSIEIMDTMEGKVSNFADAWDILRDAINDTTSEPVRAGIQGLIDVMGWLTDAAHGELGARRFKDLSEIISVLSRLDDGSLNGMTALQQIQKFFDETVTYEEGVKKLRKQYALLVKELNKDVGPMPAAGLSAPVTTEEYRKMMKARKKALNDKIVLIDTSEDDWLEEQISKDIFAAIELQDELDKLVRMSKEIWFAPLEGTSPGGLIPEDLPERLEIVNARLMEMSLAGELVQDAMDGLMTNMSSFLVAMASDSENAAEKFKKAMIGSLVAVIAKLGVAVALAAALALLTGGTSMMVGGNSEFAGKFAHVFKNLMGFASGGVSGGGLYRVGENGAETVALPQGSRVISRGDTMNALAGGDRNGGKVDFKISNDALEGTLQRGRMKNSLL